MLTVFAACLVVLGLSFVCIFVFFFLSVIGGLIVE